MSKQLTRSRYRLPKTADNKTIYPGMEIWSTDQFWWNRDLPGRPVSDTAYAVTCDRVIILVPPYTRTIGGGKATTRSDIEYCPAGALYSSEEACRQAGRLRRRVRLFLDEASTPFRQLYRQAVGYANAEAPSMLSRKAHPAAHWGKLARSANAQCVFYVHYQDAHRSAKCDFAGRGRNGFLNALNQDGLLYGRQNLLDILDRAGVRTLKDLVKAGRAGLKSASGCSYAIIDALSGWMHTLNLRLPDMDARPTRRRPRRRLKKHK